MFALLYFGESGAVIKDSLFATVGNKAITRSDILEEIKVILIVNNLSYSESVKEQLEKAAIKAVIKRNIKEIELQKYNFTKFNEADLNFKLNSFAAKLNMDLEMFKNVFETNKIDFSIVVQNIKTELQWNGLIFRLYNNRLSINKNEIDEQLKLLQNKEEINEYLISEIIIKNVSSDKVETKIQEIKNKIKIEGFENVAREISISETAIQGGDLGWLSENILQQSFKTKIINTPVGNISDPIIMQEGILIFKIRDKRKAKQFTDLEDAKIKLINIEKSKILKMYSMSHYDNLKRSIPINYY